MKRNLLLALVWLMFCPAFAGGYLIKSLTVDGSAKSESLAYVEGNKIRLSDPTVQLDFILDLDKDELTIIDLKGRYFRGKLSSLKAQAEDIQEAMMNKMLEQYPEEQREQFKKRFEIMKEQMKQPYQAQLEIRKLNETKKIAGYSATHFEILEDGAKVEDVWYTNDLRLGVIEKIAAWLNAMDVSMSFERSEKYVAQFGQGVILKSEDAEGYSSEVYEISEERNMAAYFMVPSGYQEMSFSSAIELMSGDDEE